jgi:hypothetical protein
VHTATALTSTVFSIRLNGRPAGFDSIFGRFGERDRVGVVVRRPCGAIGASTLILAAITAFYDMQRRRAEEFFIYPDYFLFHVGERFGDHRKLDIWPPHKEVVVEGDSEELLRAINDRGVTRLLIEDGGPRDPQLERESLASAQSRITTALAYAASGRVANADVQISGNAVTESYVQAVLEQSTSVPVQDRFALASARHALQEGQAPVETYRRITLDEALARL